MRHDDLAAAPCSIARSMAILGERWTLVILREAFMRARRFEDYQQGTGIARNILTDRLNKLVDAGILERRPYAEHPGRTLNEYRLTQKGIDLYPVLVALMQWGDRYGGLDTPPLTLEHTACGAVSTPRFVCSECNAEVDARDMVAHEHPVAAA